MPAFFVRDMTRPEVNTLVLLPGMDGTGELFARFVQALAPGVQTVVVRYPTDQPLGYADLAARVREALPTDRPYVLLAESFSGPIGIALAAQAPDLLKGLVLCCTFASHPRPGLRWLNRLLPEALFGAMPVAPLGRVLMGRWFDSALQADLAAAMRQVPASVMLARLQAVQSVDMSAHLRGVRVPTQYLRAHQDLVMPRSAGERIARLKPDVEFVDLPGPHFLLQTQPAASAEAVVRFLNRLG